MANVLKNEIPGVVAVDEIFSDAISVYTADNNHKIHNIKMYGSFKF